MTAPLSFVSFLIPVWFSHDILEAEDYSMGRSVAKLSNGYLVQILSEASTNLPLNQEVKLVPFLG